MWKNKNFKRWLLQSVSGLVLLQAGLCMCIESAFLKHGQAETWEWMLAGTVSLSVFYAGVSLTVDGVRFRTKWLEEKDKLNS